MLCCFFRFLFFQGWCVYWCYCRIPKLQSCIRILIGQPVNASLGHTCLKKAFPHYTHTSPVLAVCLWSNMRVFTQSNIFTLPSFRHARGCALLPSLADPERFQFPWLYPEPIHQQWAPGLHQDPDEAWRGTGLWALQEDLLCTWHLPAWWGPGTCVPLPARLEWASLWPAYDQSLPGQQVCLQMG